MKRHLVTFARRDLRRTVAIIELPPCGEADRDRLIREAVRRGDYRIVDKNSVGSPLDEIVIIAQQELAT